MYTTVTPRSILTQKALDELEANPPVGYEQELAKIKELLAWLDPNIEYCDDYSQYKKQEQARDSIDSLYRKMMFKIQEANKEVQK
jgi:hypothetical protein